MMTPRHLEIARSLIGVKEFPGAASNPVIMGWANEAKDWLGAAYINDGVSWCGLGVSYCLHAAGLKPPGKGFVGLRARQWETYGDGLPSTGTPPLGAIVVFWRKTLASGFGHVGFVDGVYANGDLSVLGFNQDDAVNVRRYGRDRLRAIRWPKGVAMTPPARLVAGNGQPVQSEA